MTQNPSPPRSDSNMPLVVILIVTLLLCVVGTGILLHQRRKLMNRLHPAPVKLDGATVAIDVGGGNKLKFVRVPAGEFMMGSNDGEPDADISEMDSTNKKHKVAIKDPFYLSEMEVTRGQYMAVMGYDPSEFKDAAKYPDVAGNMSLPADQVSWGDAHKWCDEVSKRTGLKVRLASEAEWEYACRAGTQTPYSSGEQLTSDVAQFDASAQTPPGPKPRATAAAGTHKPNAFGLYDMHGNVSEWVEDNFHDDYTGAPADGSVWKNAKTPWLHVHRGGSYNNTAPTARSAMREAGGSETEPELRTSTIGFRVVVEAGADGTK
jgi:formylglycine-generating enzyme required for sulfatase activity